MEESKVKIAEEYVSSLKRSDMFPVREAIATAFSDGMDNQYLSQPGFNDLQQYCHELEARNKELEEALEIRDKNIKTLSEWFKKERSENNIFRKCLERIVTISPFNRSKSITIRWNGEEILRQVKEIAEQALTKK